jgi:hypothetical protein
MTSSRIIRWARHVAYQTDDKCKILVGKLEGKTSVGRSSHRWNDEAKTKTDLRELGVAAWTAVI